MREMTCCSPFHLRESTLRRMIIQPRGDALAGAGLQHEANSMWVVFVCEEASKSGEAWSFLPSAPPET